MTIIGIIPSGSSMSLDSNWHRKSEEESVLALGVLLGTCGMRMRTGEEGSGAGNLSTGKCEEARW